MVLNLPLMSALTTHTYSNPREKKTKKQIKRNSNKRSKAKERQRARSLEEDKSRTPFARAMTRHIRHKTMLRQRAQATKPKLENHKELPLHTCMLPLNQCNYPWKNAYKPLEENREAASAQLSSDRSDRSPPPVRPVLNI
jgi:hypothetical protein